MTWELTYDKSLEDVVFENIGKLDNQNFHEVCGVADGLNSFGSLTSPMRRVMLTVHLPQSLVLDSGHDRNIIMSGIEREYSETTIKREFKTNARILDNVPKYDVGFNTTSIEEQPNRKIIFVDHDRMIEDGSIYLDMIKLDRIHQEHQMYGWKYVIDKNLDLTADSTIGKGTVIARSPRVDNGRYNYGFNAKVAVMSINEITEDGFVISQSLAERLVAKQYHTITINFGALLNGEVHVPLSLYGTKDKPRQFPDIGEKVREDGLVFATRVYDKLTAGLTLTDSGLRKLDLPSDNKFFLPSGFTGGKVVDITVIKGKPKGLHEKFSAQAKKYHDMIIRSKKRILEVYTHAKKKYGKVHLSPELSLDLTEIIEELDSLNDSKVIPSKKKSPLGEWHVQITVEADMKASVSSKLTGLFGNKGTVVDVWPDENMPVDQWGTRAEIIIDGDSSVKRMNWPVLLTQHLSAIADQYARDVAKWNNTDTAFTKLLGIMKSVSPIYHMNLIKLYESGKFTKEELVQNMCDDPTFYIPPYCPKLGMEALEDLEKYYPLIDGPVQYKIPGEDTITFTEEPIIIASMYLLYLEKNGTEWSAVSSPRRQHFGLYTKLNNTNKSQQPWKEQPTKFFGEPEVKAVGSNCGTEHLAAVVNRPNDPLATQTAHWAIHTTDTPSNIKSTVDYNNIETNGSRATQFVKNIFYCDGYELKRDEK